MNRFKLLLVNLFLFMPCLAVAQVSPAPALESPQARTVKYSLKDIVLVSTKVRFTTIVILPEQEKIVDFITGDKDYWVVEGNQNFCYIKPAKQGSSTNVSLITASGNIYSLLVREIGTSTEQPDLKLFITPGDALLSATMGMPRPRFVTIEEVAEIRNAAAKLAEDTKTIVMQMAEHTKKQQEAFRSAYPVNTLEFKYKFEKGKKPFLVSEIYHDDKFTYIRSAASEKPALYEVKDGTPSLINFELENGVYVVPKILDKGYLAIGKKVFAFERHD